MDGLVRSSLESIIGNLARSGRRTVTGASDCYIEADKFMISDLLIAGRGLRRSPAFTVAAIVTLALGIGANTTMFSVVNSVLLRPMPGYRTDRLVQICEASRGSCNFVAPEVYLRLRERLH